MRLFSKKKIQTLNLALPLGLLLSACNGTNKTGERLSVSLAECGDVETASQPSFESCLLEQFVGNPASETMPEDLIFATSRDDILNFGYESAERRSVLLKKTAKTHKKANHWSVHNLEKKFAMHDVFYSARQKTDAGTQNAIVRMNDYKRKAKTEEVLHYLESFDDLMKVWLDDPEVFTPEFVKALADHFYDQSLFPDDSFAKSKNGDHRVEFMFKSRRLIRLEREWGILPHEALSRAYAYAGAPEKGQRMEDIFGGTKKGRLQDYLAPVKSGENLMGALDLKILRSLDFTARDLLPILRYQIDRDTDPRIIFQNLAFAIRHGGVYVDAGNDSDDALKHAHKRGDMAAIKRFADLLAGTSVPLGNSTLDSIIRRNMLRNDLAVSRYLSAEKDLYRIKAFGKKWGLYLHPATSNKDEHPVWADTSTGDFVELAYLAEDYEAADQYIHYLLNKSHIQKQDVSKMHLRAALSTSTSIQKLNDRVDALEGFNIPAKTTKGFYTRCQKWSLYEKSEKFENCIRKLEWKPKPSAEDERNVIADILVTARAQYNLGQREKGRELFIQGLQRAAACKCQRDPSAETLGRLIAQDIELSKRP